MHASLSPKVVLALFVALSVGGGLVLGLLNTPGEWYASLTKPWFNPPNWLFGPVWTVLYVLIGIAGWRSWQRNPQGPEIKLWWLQMALNFSWTPIFFTLHQPGWALVVILALLGTLLAYMLTSYQAGHKVSALLFVPYALWVAFATLLNTALWRLNP